MPDSSIKPFLDRLCEELPKPALVNMTNSGVALNDQSKVSSPGHDAVERVSSVSTA